MNGNVALSIRQFREAWRTMCTAAPGHQLASGDGVEYIFSGLPIPFFNVAILTGEAGIRGDELYAKGQMACTWAAPSGVPWLLIVTNDALESGTDAGAALQVSGLTPLMQLTGMFATRVAPPSIPEGLELCVPEDDAGRGAILDVNSAAYGMSMEAARDLFRSQVFWHGHFPVLGQVDGQPVSSAVVMMVDGYRYVALVATVPSHQRRGYADAAMRRALEVSARIHGEQATFLHATDAGRPVYERMGYTAVCSHTIFIEKRFLGQH